MSELLKRVRRVRRWIERALEMGEKGDMMGLVEDLELAQAELSSVREEMWGALLGSSRRRSSRRLSLSLCVALAALVVLVPAPLSFPPSCGVLSLSVQASLGLGAGLVGLGELVGLVSRPTLGRSGGGDELSSRSQGELFRAEAAVSAPISSAKGSVAEVGGRRLPELGPSVEGGPGLSAVREGEVARLVRLARRELSGGGAIRVLVKVDEQR